MAETASNSMAGGARILVVEDDPLVYRMYERALSKNGYMVSLANTSQAAEEQLGSQAFDVIISDICLDGKDGLTLLEASQAQNPDTPVILVTGQPSIETASAAVRLNAYEYLVKPVSLEVLSKAVGRAAAFKTLKADQKKTELEKRKYQHDLELLVTARTEKLIQTYQRYQEQNAFLTNVIESLAHPFMVIDAQDFSVKIANAAAKKNHSGQGATCFALNHGFDRPCSQLGQRCVVEEVVKTRCSVHLEHAHLNLDEKESDYEVHAFPLFNENGEVKQVIQYCIDITEKKRLEAIAEAVNLMDNLGFIFSGIRHEIGNPLNSVKMALSVLDKNLDRYPRQTIREFVGRSLGELSRVEYLLKAFKNFSMFETPRMENVNIGSFLNNFKSLVEEDFSRKQIHIFLDVPPGDVFVSTDPRAFHQVILNVMTNAADALTKSERPMIDIAVDRIPGFVRVQVRDNGCGMTPDEHKNLFRPFYTSKAQGTGLGLMIVKKMLSKMNSTIRIESIYLEGTTVTMTLPEGMPLDDDKS
jgi:signal transduction histidine kinase/DNA-binding response OmpR family regulator